MINVVISSDPRYSVNRNLIRSTVVNTLENHHIYGQVEVGVNIIGDRKMHELNRQYRGIDATTDILSFALEDPNPAFLQHVPRVGFVAAPDKILRLGDIVISHPQAVEDASMDGTTVDEQIKFLVEHGIQHLLGIHHAES